MLRNVIVNARPRPTTAAKPTLVDLSMLTNR